VRDRGVTVDVVSPTDFRHFGIAYGDGIVQNLRREPLRVGLVPAMLGAFAQEARRRAREADLVHAHWLAAGVAALTTGKPFVLQVWGTDVELARRLPALARPVVRRAQTVLCASTALAEAARRLGAGRVRVIPNGVDLPESVGGEAEPPEVLYAGRLSEEKGILELVEAAAGLRLVVAGDGPLRDRVADALGFVPNDQLQGLYARAAVVACPSRREGFGVACLEAMAHGRPVVASAVGGLVDLVVDGETGLLVPPRDPAALRAALHRLLADRELRRSLGAAARERAREQFSWGRSTDLTLEAYAEAIAGASEARRSPSTHSTST
jgi:glycosyltransferase involved in cell wall biosynthesis